MPFGTCIVSKVCHMFLHTYNMCIMSTKMACIVVIVAWRSLMPMVCIHSPSGSNFLLSCGNSSSAFSHWCLLSIEPEQVSVAWMSSCKAKHGYMQDRDAQHARGMQEASERVVHDLEAKSTQLRSQLERSQQALHAVKAQYGQQETLVQTQQHMDKLQSDLASERQEVTKLTGRNQEVAKAKQDVLLATKALQVGKLPVHRHIGLICKIY